MFNIFKDLERRGSDNPAVADQHPEIMTFAGVIFDFPPRDQRLEQYFPRDAYSEFFDEDDNYGSFMSS